MNTYAIDFEYRPIGVAHPHPRPWCVVAKNLETGDYIRLWLGDSSVASPFPPQFCMVAYYALAELGCFLQLDWALPDEVLDALPEARTILGQNIPGRSWKLLDVATYFGIATMSTEHKDEMRDLACQDEVPENRRQELLAYCEEDVNTLVRVWEKLEPKVALQFAKLRGRYLKALAAVERRGIPVDVRLVELLVAHGEEIKTAAWDEVRDTFPGVISGTGSFSNAGWLAWCVANGIHWPVHPTGAPQLDEDTFKKMADAFPQVRVVAYARKLRGKSRGFEFPGWQSGRLRCMLSPFGSDTGRNQPPSGKFIFGASAWLRSVVMAPEGSVLVYADYAAQEFALAAALSGDAAMMADYRTGDPYLAFAKRIGAIPAHATKESHGDERKIYKVAVLSIQYGISPESLAAQWGWPVSRARRLATQHREEYGTYWNWRQAVIDTVSFGNSVTTCYGWRRGPRHGDKSNSVGNFLVQATGAEIMRIAVIAMDEGGHRLVAPVHDGFLIEMDTAGHERELERVLDKLRRASLAVVPGLEVRVGVEVVPPGARYVDGRGSEMWKLVAPIIGFDPLRQPPDATETH